MRFLVSLALVLVVVACSPAPDVVLAPAETEPGVPRPLPDEPPGDEAEGVAHVDTPRGEAAMELVLERGLLGTDEQVVFRLVNRGKVTLVTGSDFSVERWDGAAWQPLPFGGMWDLMGRVLSPGEELEAQRWPLDDRLRMEPGWHRIVKAARWEDPDHAAADAHLEARTRFRVAGGPPPEPPPDETLRDDLESPVELGSPYDWTPDDLWYAASLEVPAFAGLYLSGGELVVLVTDGRQLSAEEALARVLALDERGLAAELAGLPVRAEQARYSWRELYEWHRWLGDEIHTIPGFAFSDIDDLGNRVTIGLQDRQAEPHARAAARRAGIPDDAFHVE